MSDYKRSAEIQTKSLIKFIPNTSVYVQFKGNLEERPLREGESKPMIAAECVNLETGESCILAAPSIVESKLKELGDLVGKKVEIIKGDKVAGKRYVNYQVFLLED